MNDILNYYNSQDEDSRLDLDRAHRLEYYTTMKYLEKLCLGKLTILDACAGTGAYCFDLAMKGYVVTAGDLVQKNVELIQKKNADNPILKEIYVGDILDLSIFSENSFDVVLCLGAFYHLHNEEDRKQAILECKRVAKKDGIIAVAYLNRFASFMNNFSNHSADFKTILNEFYTGNKNVFYRSKPNGIEKMMTELEITMLYNIGTDGTSYMYSKQLEALSDEEYQQYLEYHLHTCEDKSILGHSLHGLFIGRV